MNGQQGGDPAKLADALIHLAGQEEPPLRFAAGADAVAAFERRANNLLAQANTYSDLSSSLALDSDQPVQPEEAEQPNELPKDWSTTDPACPRCAAGPLRPAKRPTVTPVPESNCRV
jgi:hypothetical protein